MDRAYSSLKKEGKFWSLRPKRLLEFLEVIYPDIVGVPYFSDHYTSQRSTEIQGFKILIQKYIQNDNKQLYPIACFYGLGKVKNTEHNQKLLEIAAVLEDMKMSGSPDYC
jgi:hypothetical protein